MEELPVRIQLPHRERLAEVLAVAQGTISLELATFWTEQRGDDPRVATGCLIGHYIKVRQPKHLALVPLNFLEQIKAPIVADKLFQRHPPARWHHYTVHYNGPEVEAWGLTAVCLYFQIRAYDAQRLFYPNGTNYVLQPEVKAVAERLRRFIAVERVLSEVD